MTATATSHRSFCRVCTAVCGILVEVEGDQVVRVRGDADHPLSRGYTCAKGRAVFQAHHHPDRLERPQVGRGAGAVEMSWDESLDDLAQRLRQIIDESGPSAVGVFLGGGAYMDASAYLVARIVRRVLGTDSFYSDLTIDVISKSIVSDLMAGLGGVLTRPDYPRCNMVMYVGSNPVVSHGHTSMLMNPVARMREMTARGQVWVIDPRRSETAALATRHLAPRASTDYAVFAYLTRELLVAGADRTYLVEHAQDVDVLAAAVEAFTAERAAAITGLDPSDLTDLLAAVRKAGTVAIDTGTGVSMSPAANVTQWLTWAVMIITGSMDREGGAWANPGFLLQLDRMDLAASPPEGFRGLGPASRPELLSIGGEYPAAAIADEIEAGNLRAIINFSGNLVACLPGTDRIVPALEKLDVLATIDVIANETTAVSTHVLPVKDQLERADLPFALDLAYPCIATQYTPPVVEPVGNRRGVWWVFGQLGRELGYDFLPGLDPDVATDDDVLRTVTAGARMPLDEFRHGELVQLEEVVTGWIERHVDRMGGWRMAPAPLVAQLVTMTEPAPLVLIPRRQPRHINARFRELGDRPDILVNAEDAAAAGVADGALAIVRSAHGELQGTVKVDPAIRPGALSVPHGWPELHNVNRLTSGHDVDPLSGMPRYSGLAVTLHAVAEGEKGTGRFSACVQLV